MCEPRCRTSDLYAMRTCSHKVVKPTILRFSGNWGLSFCGHLRGLKFHGIWRNLMMIFKFSIRSLKICRRAPGGLKWRHLKAKKVMKPGISIGSRVDVAF